MTMMRAVVITRPGGPEVLELAQHPVPVPAEGEALVRVRATALNRADLLQREVDDYYGNFRVSADLIELRNLLDVARLIIRSALDRTESRGLHYTLDYPETLPDARDTVLVP